MRAEFIEQKVPLTEEKLVGRFSTSDVSEEDEEYTIGLEDLPQEEFSLPELSSWSLLVLTFPNFGMQLVWTILQIFGTPYLKSLGFTESETAMVWLAGPLAGMFGQPVFGVLSDHCHSSWGKRKPFIVGGSIVTMVCMPVLAWAAELSRYRVATINPPSHEAHEAGFDDGVDAVLAKVIAAVSIYILFIAMQAVQVGVRSLPVDQAPPHQQPQASLWGSRMCAFGAVTAGLLGFIGGSTSFKFLAIVSCTLLLIGILISIRQREGCPPPSPASMAEKGETATTSPDTHPPPSLTPLSLFRFILTTLRTLPPVTRRTCQTQLFSWFAWFIILQYTSTYISSVATTTTDPSSASSASSAGTLAGLLFNAVALGVNLVLPTLIALLPSAAAKRTATTTDPRPSSVPAPFLSRLWQLSHVLLASCMFGTHLARGSTPAATALFGATGVTWAVSQWVPFALITKELSIIQAQQQQQQQQQESDGDDDDDHGRRRRGENRIGTVLGVHVIASTFPQAVSALVTTCLLRVTEALGGGGNGVGVALQLAGVGALGAAVWGQWRWRECVKAGF